MPSPKPASRRSCTESPYPFLICVTWESSQTKETTAQAVAQRITAPRLNRANHTLNASRRNRGARAKP